LDLSDKDLSSLGATAPPRRGQRDDNDVQDNLAALGAAAPPYEGYRGKRGQKTPAEEVHRYVVFYLACRGAGMRPWAYAERIGWAKRKGDRCVLRSMKTRYLTMDYLIDLLWPAPKEHHCTHSPAVRIYNEVP
jgi:hypothetical protein